MYDPIGKTRVTQDMIAGALRELGIRTGDLLHVHSSLSALGHVEGGAESVVDALLQVVGPTGTVMVPTFNHGAADVFDVKSTPSTNGAVTEAFWRRSEARRSVHPTHPCAAIGPLAGELIREHLDTLTFGARSPLGKLASMGGWVLLLGVGMEVNTSAHVGETLARVPCLGYRKFPRKILTAGGDIVDAWSVQWRDGPCAIEWEALQRAMREREMIRDGQVGDGETHLMRAEDVVQTTIELTKLLCPACGTRPKSDS